jgi:isoprenylcysteine carboxyl methyltransferase (ICMT) family protein YpbQ
MKCKDCQHFKVKYEPLRSLGAIWDTGLAVCEKHDLVCDWLTKQQLNRLECVEEVKQ